MQWPVFVIRVDVDLRFFWIMSQESCYQPLLLSVPLLAVLGLVQLFKGPRRSLLFILLMSSYLTTATLLKWNVKSQISMGIHGWGSGASAPTFEYLTKVSESGEISWLSDCKITGSCRGCATVTPQPSETQRVKAASSNYSSPELRLRDAAMGQKFAW